MPDPASSSDAAGSAPFRSWLVFLYPSQCIGQAEPAHELLLRTVCGTEASADRLAVGPQLKLEP